MRNAIRVVVVVVALLILYIGTRPGQYRVERSTTIAAPGAAVFARLDDFHQWAAWSPWDKLDPQMSKVYEGPASGVGASYHWTGNDKVGEGRMTISQSEPPAPSSRVRRSIRPMARRRLLLRATRAEAGPCGDHAGLRPRSSGFHRVRSHHGFGLPAPAQADQLHAGHDGVPDALFSGRPLQLPGAHRRGRPARHPALADAGFRAALDLASPGAATDCLPDGAATCYTEAF